MAQKQAEQRVQLGLHTISQGASPSKEGWISGSGSNAGASGATKNDIGLPTFSELDRMCHPVEEGCGHQCGEGGSNDNLVLEVGDEFVEVSVFLHI